MKSQKGLRHLLPIGLTTITVALLWPGFLQERDFRKNAERAKAEVQLQQTLPPNEATFTVYDFPHMPPQSVQWAMAINLPVVITSLPAILLMNYTSTGSADYISYLVVGVLTPFFWFVVGRWLDRRLRWVEPEAVKNPSENKVFVFGLCSALLALFGSFFLVALLTRSVHHGVLIPWAVVCWSAFGTTFFLFRSRLERTALAKEAVST